MPSNVYWVILCNNKIIFLKPIFSVISYKYKNLRIPVYKSEVYFCNLEDIKKLFMTRVVDTLNVTKTSIYPPNLERELLYLDISRGARYGFKGTVQEIWI